MNLVAQRIIMGAAALSASALIAACGARSTNSSNETFTVYEDAPKMSLLDLGQPGNSPGDVYHFSAPLRSSSGGQITGEVFGSKTLIKLATLKPIQTWRKGERFCFSPLAVVRTKLSLSELLIIRQRPVNSRRASPSSGRF